jgi:hypothetical protein
MRSRSRIPTKFAPRVSTFFWLPTTFFREIPILLFLLENFRADANLPLFGHDVTLVGRKVMDTLLSKYDRKMIDLFIITDRMFNNNKNRDTPYFFMECKDKHVLLIFGIISDYFETAVFFYIKTSLNVINLLLFIFKILELYGLGGAHLT